MKNTVCWRNKILSIGMIVFLIMMMSACSDKTTNYSETGSDTHRTEQTGVATALTGITTGITAAVGYIIDWINNYHNEGLTFLADPNGNATWSIWLMGTDGSNKAMLADNPGAAPYDWEGAVQQTMSPDGNTLVYVLQGPRGQMVSKNLSTGVVTVLVDDVETSFDPTPSFSYDGTKIAYSMNHSESEYGIRVMNADGSNIQVLTTTDNDVTPAFNRSGDKIVFDRGRNGSIYVMNTDGSGLTLVKDGTGDIKYGHPQFLPDGRILCMRVDTTPDPDNKDIVIMNADGSNEINLTPGTESSSEWSPTVNLAGDKIAFSTDRNKTMTDIDDDGYFDDETNYDVYLGTLSGNSLINLQNLTGDVGYRCWRPRFVSVP
jgi:Tol biopolymer transport system component